PTKGDDHRRCSPGWRSRRRRRTLQGGIAMSRVDFGIYADMVDRGEAREQLHNESKHEHEYTSRDSQSDRTAWDLSQTAEDCILAGEEEIEFLFKPLLAPGSITELFSPRGLGKTHVGLGIAKHLSERGFRVLLLDRDNSKREVRRRLRAWGAGNRALK